MQIHVARNSVQLGIFASEEVVAGLSSGRFHPSDLAWRDGMQAWTPLGDWPEFRGSGVPATPGAPAVDAPASSAIPWEQGKSLGSFFATIKMAVSSPPSLASGRFAFGDWVAFCYLGVLLSLPFQLFSLLAFGDKNAEVAGFLKRLHSPELDKIADQLAIAEPAPVGLTIFSLMMGLAFAPLLYAFFAVMHWLGQRVFRYQVPLERTVSACLLMTSAMLVLMAPLQLLGFSLVAQMLVSLVVLVPVCVAYYRALGAATGISPWVQFGISCFVWFLLGCCCCVAPYALLDWFLAGKGMSFGG